MGERRALVIGSQCDSLGLPLTFLPNAAKSLFDVLTDPRRGACDKDRSRLVIDPELPDMVTEVNSAVADADADQATLIVAFIGHAEAVNDRLYLFPRNGISPPTMDTGFPFGWRLTELIGRYSGVDGLVLLLDACESGKGLVDAMHAASRDIGDAQMRLQLITATYDQAARDGCFSRTLHKLLRDGLEDPSHDLLAAALIPHIRKTCTAQQEPRSLIAHYDPGLWLAHNVRARRPGPFRPGTPDAHLVDDVTRSFQPTDVLRQLVGASSLYRLVVVEGHAGCGKSALSAAVADPAAAGIAELGIVPSRFVQALVFASLAPTPQSVATALREQLSANVDGFTSAREAYQAELTEAQRALKGRLELEVVGPLRRLHKDRPDDVARIGILLDGWYQLPAEVKDTLTPFLRALSDPGLPRVRLIVTTRLEARPEIGDDVRESSLLQVVRASNGDIGRYFRRRGVRGELQDQLVSLAEGRWLHARLLADVTTREVSEPTPPPPTLDELYASELRRVADIWGAGQLHPVLCVLAALLTTGPVLPLLLLRDASGRLGGPNGPAHVRNVLAELKGLVVRAGPGTEQEQVGLFHDDLREYIKQALHTTSPDGDPVEDGHRALVEAIDRLAPAHPRTSDPVLRNYADRYHGEHLWALKRYSDVVAVFADRPMRRPADNRDMWQRCLRRAEAEQVLDLSHPLALQAERAFARWTGRAGDYAAAVRLLQTLQRRCKEAGEPAETLATEGELFHWVGMLEGPRSALESYLRSPTGRRSALDSYWEREVATAKTCDPLEVYREIAYWIGELGRPADAVRMLDDRFFSRMDALCVDPHSPATLAARRDLGRWTAEAGAVRRGLERLQQVWKDLQAFTPDDTTALFTTRHGIAYWKGELGRLREARDECEVLLSQYGPILSANNPEILMLRHNLAHWIGQSGDNQTALDQLQDVLAKQEELLPQDHRDTLATRQRLAYYKGRSGRIREALEDLRGLKQRERRTFPAIHIHRFRTWHQIANWSGELGDPGLAERLLSRLLRLALTRLSSDHPDVFAMRCDRANWIGEAGQARCAKGLLEELRDDMHSDRAPFVAGDDDPRLLVVEGRLAYWAGESGDPARQSRS